MLEESFSLQGKAPRAASLLDPKRSQAVAILLRSIHLRMEDICEAIVMLDSSIVDTESIRALRDNVRKWGEEGGKWGGGGGRGENCCIFHTCVCICVHVCVHVCM